MGKGDCRRVTKPGWGLEDTRNALLGRVLNYSPTLQIRRDESFNEKVINNMSPHIKIIVKQLNKFAVKLPFHEPFNLYDRKGEGG